MIFYAQRFEAANSVAADDFVDELRDSGIVWERPVENLLKVWLGIEYVQSRVFWRRRFYTDDGHQLQAGLIATYAPAYIHVPGVVEANKFPIDIIALDKKCFDGATELMRRDGVTPRKMDPQWGFTTFPDNALVEGFYFVDYSAKIEQAIGFDEPQQKKTLLSGVMSPPTSTRRYFSVTFSTNHKILDGVQLSTVTLEGDNVVLNIVPKDPVADSLTEENQAEFISRISSLLDTLHKNPEAICRRG